MKYSDLKLNMKVCDGYKYGYIRKINKRTVWVQWSSEKSDYWIYDIPHLQFLNQI